MTVSLPLCASDRVLFACRNSFFTSSNERDKRESTKLLRRVYTIYKYVLVSMKHYIMGST